MGCHIFDPVFESIGLTAPMAVRSEGPPPNEWNWSLNGKVIYTFAGTSRTAAETLPVTWYDGTSQPAPEILALIEGEVFPDAGSIFVGAEGVMLLPHYSLATLFPRAKFADFKLPHVNGLKHWEQFVEACRGNDKTTADFAYAGPLTETILLGDIAARFPQTTLEWNSHKLRFNQTDANQYVRRKYRKHWSVAGLG